MTQTPIEHLHRFHPYCARFPSEIVESVLEAYTSPGDSVFDPFCGSGTSLVAALARGRKAVGTDIDILAGMLSELKCRPLAPERYASWRQQFSRRVEAAFGEIARNWSPPSAPRPGVTWSVGNLELYIPQFQELRYWFPPQLIASLAAIAKAAHDCREPHYERVALIALSACILSKWPNTLSYAMDVDHTRPHRRTQRFTLDQTLEFYLGRLDRCLDCLGQLHQVYQQAGVLDDLADSAHVVFPHDARVAVPDLSDESQALVVTSPPYFNAVDYPRAHRLSVCWMNGHAPADLVSRKKYIGLRHAPDFDADDWLKTRPAIRRRIPTSVREDESIGKRLTAFYADLEIVLGHTWRALRPGGHAVYVIANNVIRGERVDSHAVLTELGKATGFGVVQISSRKIATLRRRFPVGPFGFDGPMTHEYVVVLRKPPSRGKVGAGGLHA